MRALGATAFCAALACAVAWCSQVPFPVERAEDALIRLSWRAVGKAVEACRTPSAEELAQLPVHMRRTEICERRLTTFRLVVALDGAQVIDARVAPEGAQRDRPAYVLRELRVAPGSHQIAVRFSPEDEAEPPPLALDAHLELAAREVALVTEGSQSGRLEIRRRSHRP